MTVQNRHIHRCRRWISGCSGLGGGCRDNGVIANENGVSFEVIKIL